jgi:PAS domain S-box-containing protein
VTFVRPDDLPAGADTDRQSFRAIGTRSMASVPLRVSGTVVGAVRVATTRAERHWSPEFMEQMQLLAEIFGSALAAARAAEDRREQEELFRATADAAPVMIWISGLDAGRDFLNRPWLDFTGRPLDEERGRGWIKGVHADDVVSCLDTYLSAFRDRRPFRTEYRLRRHDGEYRWILDSGRARFAADGIFTGYIGSCVDVTEQHRADAVMQESTALRSAILGSLYGRVATLDAGGVIIAVNESWTAAVKEFGADPARTSVGASYLDVCRKASGDLDAQKAGWRAPASNTPAMARPRSTGSSWPWSRCGARRGAPSSPTSRSPAAGAPRRKRGCTVTSWRMPCGSRRWASSSPRCRTR